jgi:hypothetical protein
VRATRKRRQRTSIDWDHPIRSALEAADPKPAISAARDTKKNYAERLSRELARVMADGLRAKFPDITPDIEGGGQESLVGADRGRKRLDVKAWDKQLGLVLNVSIKTYSFPDWSPSRKRASRYTKNMKRNDFELRAEADVVHRRQPYAVLIAVMFMPIASSRDGNPDAKNDTNKSSFAHSVLTLRGRTGRKDPDDRFDKFERVYIALYEGDGERRGETRFFEVGLRPPRNGAPRSESTLTFQELLDVIYKVVAERNELEPEWDEAELLIDEVLDEGD